MKNKYNHHLHKIKRAPLWKWVLIIFLVIAMPLFFAYVRGLQMQQALNNASEMERNKQTLQQQKN